MSRMKLIKWKLSLLLVMVLSGSSMARDCPSELATGFKPLAGVSSLTWGIEAILSQGWMDGADMDRTIRTSNILFGFDYRPLENSTHQFYLESGLKYWYNSGQKPGLGPGTDGWSAYPRPEKNHLGFREGFYRFNGGGTSLTAGLHTVKLADKMLIDERMLGISLKHEIGQFKIDIHGGTVSTDFARTGDFCSTRHVYQLVRGGRFNLVSNDLGETNLVAGMISWSPSTGNKHQKSLEIKVQQSGGKDKSESLNDEPDSDDNFGEFEEFESVGDESFSMEQKQNGLLKKVGLIFIEEFGNGFHEYKYYYGGMAEITLPASFNLDLEVVFQHIFEEKAIAYLAELSRDIIWDTGALTDLSFGYLGTSETDEGARFYPAFSNLLLGKVVRLDSYEMPLYKISAKHTFPWKLKPSFKAFMVQQVEGSHTREIDFEFGLSIARNLKINWIQSIISSDRLDGHANMSKLELRWVF